MIVYSVGMFSHIGLIPLRTLSFKQTSKSILSIFKYPILFKESL